MRPARPIISALLLLLGVGPGPVERPDPIHHIQGVEKLTPLPGAQSGTQLPSVEQRYPFLFDRSLEDRPDQRPGRQIHVVYIVGADMPDDRLDELGVVEDSIRSINHWMRQQTGNQQWVFDTHTFARDDPVTTQTDPQQVEAIDVTFVRSGLTGTALADTASVRAELDRVGLDHPEKRYLSLVAGDAGGTCGEAVYPPWSTSLEPTDGKYAQVYLYGDPACRARDYAASPTEPSFTEAIAVHELIHTDGVVPYGAPHSCVVGLFTYLHVCTGPLWATPEVDPEGHDVMFPYLWLPLTEQELDADHVDYYRHPAPNRDLEQSLYLETA